MLARLALDGLEAAESCKLIGNFFGYCVQLALFAVCLSTLLIKWYIEVPRRRLLVFLMDSTKQIVGSMWLHFLNLFIAIRVSAVGVVNKAPGDECTWYWTHLMADCTIGLVVVYVILRLSERKFGYRSGYYYNTLGADGGQEGPDWGKWGMQIAGYLAIVSVKKLSVSVMIWMTLPLSVTLGTFATSWLSNAKLRLLFVMVLTPMVMDTFSMWVTDSFIKFQSSGRLQKEELSTCSSSGGVSRYSTC